MAKSLARALLAVVNPAVSGTIPAALPCQSHARWSQRYTLGGSRAPPAGTPREDGCLPGQSARRFCGGLMTAQLANDMVRDHKNSPSLLVSPTLPVAAANHAMYPATGSRPAARAASAVRQPDLMTSRYTANATTSGSVLGRTMAEAPISAAAAADRHTDGDFLTSRTANAATMRNIARMSAMTYCSISS